MQRFWECAAHLILAAAIQLTNCAGNLVIHREVQLLPSRNGSHYLCTTSLGLILVKIHLRCTAEFRNRLAHPQACVTPPRDRTSIIAEGRGNVVPTATAIHCRFTAIPFSK
jgi:hypothetical protein